MSGISMMEEEHFRNNLILLEGKNFGKIFEIIVSRLANLEKAGDASHDWYCSLSSSRIEVKAIRAFFSHEKMNDGNLIEMLLEGSKSKKLVNDKRKKIDQWNGGVCQIKLNCFEFLYYCAVFYDKIYFFITTPEKISNDKKICFSKKQHRNGNMGQFHLTPQNIDHHIENYLYKQLTYKQLISILKFSLN
jgi:hypothetical protein